MVIWFIMTGARLYPLLILLSNIFLIYLAKNPMPCPVHPHCTSLANKRLSVKGLQAQQRFITSGESSFCSHMRYDKIEPFLPVSFEHFNLNTYIGIIRSVHVIWQ